MDFASADSAALVGDLREQVRRLESRLIHLEGDGKSSHIRDKHGLPDVDETSSILHNEDDQPLHLQYRPEIRRCNFAEFKNRFSEWDACAAVDVLVSGELLQQECLEEQRLRDRLSEHVGADASAAKRKANALVRETARNNSALRTDQSDRTWIQRIRIQAPALLDFLARIQKESWSMKPRTYWRPFMTLIYYQPEVKRTLAELEEGWAHHDRLQYDSAGIQGEASPGVPGAETGYNVFSDYSHATRDILRTYVKFIDEEVIPDAQQFDGLDFSSNATIRFTDLCYLFNPGDFLYRPSETEKLSQRGSVRDANMGERVWRVLMVYDALKRSDMQTSDQQQHISQTVENDDDTSVTVQAYHIDYNGDEFCVAPQTFRIPPFEGQRAISTLPFFPIRFKEGHEALLKAGEELGETVLQYLDSKHAYYDDWTVIRNAQGGFVTDSNGLAMKHPEYINSEVMVDFQEAFQKCPTWQPQRTVLRAEYINKLQMYDDFPIRWQSGPDRAKIIRETLEIRPYRTGVQRLKGNAFIREDPFLVAVANNAQRGVRTTEEWLRREEKILIHGRVFAYVFRERKFAQLDVSKLKPSSRNLEALEALKIPDKKKRMIQGSVRGHFLQKEVGGRRAEETLSQDVIQGKGAGLFILLHGVPGVGKTMTAEAVAQANGKPLFKITCGDIGVRPEQVETALREIFRLASTWDCILLMDEVDTFFAQRSKGDGAIKKNALVTVFLRVLDYYTGILFLTTNRPGALDEAFKSRIHYKIYYPPLTKDQTLEIWRLNIKRLSQINDPSHDRRPLDVHDNDIMEFAEWQFDEAKRRGYGQWNGRQIRNAFQVSRSLAHYDAMPRSENTGERHQNGLRHPAILSVEYFHMMNTITEDFDQYMLAVYSGQSDRDLALEMEHRADHWVSDRWPRAARMQQDVEDPYQRYNDTRSPFNADPSRDGIVGERRPSVRGTRPSIGAHQRLPSDTLAPPTAVQYDEPNMGTRSSPLPRQRLFDPHSSPVEESEAMNQHNPFAPSRPAGGIGSSAVRGQASNMAGYRDMRQQGAIYEDAAYQTERNDYGKRERLI